MRWNMNLYSLGIFLASFIATVLAAGRRFPDEARKLTVQHFQQINPNIDWDDTFFLSDYSSRYSLCKYINDPGIITVNRLMPVTRQRITGIRAVTDGPRGSAYAANGYIRRLLDSWEFNQQIRNMARESSAIGCSIRPMCSGRAVITCLFSGAREPLPTLPPPTRPPPTRPPPPPTYPPTPPPTYAPAPTPPSGIQRALAFTPQEYELTERVTGQEWDGSHLLENLSGYETLCDMIGTNSWAFETAIGLGTHMGLTGLYGKYGYARNVGSTPNAMEEILRAWNWPADNSDSFFLGDEAPNTNPFDSDLPGSYAEQGSGLYDPFSDLLTDRGFSQSSVIHRPMGRQGFNPFSVYRPMSDQGYGQYFRPSTRQGKTKRELVIREMGCSVIPDCIEPDGQMYVVVSCVFMR